MLKIFVFNSTEEWTTKYGYAVFAETKEEAEKAYFEILGETTENISIQEFEIKTGLALYADGYDKASMKVVKHG